MSMSAAVPEARSDAVAAIGSLRDVVVVALALVAALAVLYAVFLDQGQLLHPVLGKAATASNYIHEFAHDGRHLLGAPCH